MIQFMASKCNTTNNSIDPNQSPTWENKIPATTSKKFFKVPSDFIASHHTRRYPLEIPTQTSPDISYTSSPNTPHQYKDSSLNEELWGVTMEDPLYHIPNTEVDQICCHTRAYFKSIGKIPIIYQIQISWASQRRAQLYSDDKTLTSNIDNLIINAIWKIHQPIVDIAHSETFKDPKFRNLLNFLEGYFAFLDFLETQVGGFGPPKPPKTYPPLASIPSPRLNFNFWGNMAGNKPWLTINFLSIPSPQNHLPKHPKKIIPMFDHDKDILPKYHIKKFFPALNLMNVQHEHVVCRLFCFTFEGKESSWFFNLSQGPIASWKKFETAFMTQFGDNKTSRILFLDLSRIKINKKDRFEDFNQRFITLLYRIHDKLADAVQIEFYSVALPPLISMFIKRKEQKNFGLEFCGRYQSWEGLRNNL